MNEEGDPDPTTAPGWYTAAVPALLGLLTAVLVIAGS
jgi:hypothetical protein